MYAAVPSSSLQRAGLRADLADGTCPPGCRTRRHNRRHNSFPEQDRAAGRVFERTSRTEQGRKAACPPGSRTGRHNSRLGHIRLEYIADGARADGGTSASFPETNRAAETGRSAQGGGTRTIYRTTILHTENMCNMMNKAFRTRRRNRAPCRQEGGGPPASCRRT